MTLAEIIIVVVLIGILSTIGVVNYRKTVVNSHRREAQSMLRLIQHAEEVVRLETNAYVACNGKTACDAALRLDLPTGDWTYSVTLVGTTNFCAEATSANYGAYHIGNTATNADPLTCGCGGGNCPS